MRKLTSRSDVSLRGVAAGVVLAQVDVMISAGGARRGVLARTPLEKGAGTPWDFAGTPWDALALR